MLRTSFVLFAVTLSTAAAQSVSLFDGTSLEGWKGDPAVWSVQEGRIAGHCDGSATRGSALVWQGDALGDFVLRFRARLGGEARAGVLYRARLHEEGDGDKADGYRAVLRPAPWALGMLSAERQGRGALARRGEMIEVASSGRTELLAAVGNGAPVDAGAWHDYAVIARGDHLIHEIDGVAAVDVTDHCRDRPSRGALALRIEPGPPADVWFEDVSLERLDGDGPRRPQWIWARGHEGDEPLWLRRTFTLPAAVQHASLYASCDNRVSLFLNGAAVLESTNWEDVTRVDVTGALGRANVLAARCQNEGGPAALAVRLVVELAGGERRTVVSDASWRVHDDEQDGWQAAAFDDRGWRRAATLGPVGGEVVWSQRVGVRDFGLRAPPSPPQPAEDVPAITTLPGFRVQLLYRVPRATEGSWVSLTADDRGRLIASAQHDAGLFRITPAALGDPSSRTVAERIDVPLSGAQGLCWAFGGLYAMINSEGESGLYRVVDTDGDDRLDSAQCLRRLAGEGEHGPHAVILARDGKSLICSCGNHTDLTEISGSRLPAIWGEDLLLPRQWDANGHARGRLAPGGWICKVDPEGRHWEVISSGYRNEYDLAYDDDGELFTFDADMEWDMGMPWYRPTRLCHVVSGSEYGWRSGSGKWPADYPDSLPPVLELGPGSPTGVVAGRGLRFPARYQRALFLLDWTFGTIYAVHLTPDGASYRAQKEEFLSGHPLAVSDAVVGRDGALYFTTGGRGLESALYRVVYDGDDTAPEPAAADPIAAQARELRHRLESFHGHVDPAALSAAWPWLGDRDRFVRYAARVAIESQPVATWSERALGETDPQAALEALLALARHGDASVQPALLEALGRLEPEQLDAEHQVAALRVLELALIRMGRPGDDVRRALVERLDGDYPSSRARVDAELARLLVYLDAPDVIEKTLALMASTETPAAPAWGKLITRNDKYGAPIRRMLADMPPVQKIGYAFALRNVHHGWTLQQRREYFSFFPRAARHPGGSSYRGYLENIRDDALSGCSEQERTALADLTGLELRAREPAKVVQPGGPGQLWTVESALAAAGGHLQGRDPERGRGLFHGALCATCHRFDGEGGSVGPDLTSVGNKMSVHDLVESIVEPSKVISDQYASSLVHCRDGSVVFGRAVRCEDGAVEVHLPTPGAAPVRVAADAVEKIEPSPVSQMPTGLLTPLNPDELRDLLAYLLSGSQHDG